MTKNELSRTIIQALYNLDNYPDADNPNVVNMAKRNPKHHLEDMFENAKKILDDKVLSGVVRNEVIEKDNERRFAVNQIVKGKHAGTFIILGFRNINGVSYAQLKSVDPRDTTKVSPGELALPLTHLEKMDDVEYFDNLGEARDSISQRLDVSPDMAELLALKKFHLGEIQFGSTTITRENVIENLRVHYNKRIDVSQCESDKSALRDLLYNVLHGQKPSFTALDNKLYALFL